MYTELLHYYRPAVVPVSDTRDALMLAAEACIVVTGMNLGDPMDGVELVSRFAPQRLYEVTPIIAPTAGAWPNDRARAEGAGCDVFLPKPCLPNGLLAEVRQLLAATHSQTADTPHVLQIPFTPHRASSNSIITLMASGSFIARYPRGHRRRGAIEHQAGLDSTFRHVPGISSYMKARTGAGRPMVTLP